METNKKTFGIIIVFIFIVSTLVTITTTRVESKCVPLRDSFVARSLLSVFPPSDSPSPAPAPGPESIYTPAEIDTESPAPSSESPAESPTEIDIDYPAPSSDAPADSFSPANSPAERDVDSPAPSPDAPSDSFSPANSPAERDVNSPTPSPDAPADSFSPANPPAERDFDSPAPSTDAPGDSFSPANPPAERDVNSPASSISPANSPAEIVTESPAPSPLAPANSISPTNPPETPHSIAPSGPKLKNSPKNQPNQPSLSPEIKAICAKTDSPPLCESSITPLITPDLKPDATSVLLLAIQASIDATKAAMPTVDKTAAADCQELYDDAVANLEDAINAVKSRDMPTVNTNLSAAMTDYGTCNDGFEESGEPNPLADVGDKLTKMVSNCLAISTLIK